MSIPPFDNFTSGAFTSFDVSGLGIAVAPGDILAIALSNPSGNGSFFVYDAELDIYAGGTSYISGLADGSFTATTRDIGFRTVVAVPEPTALCGGLVAMLAAWRRRRSWSSRICNRPCW